MKLVRGFTLVEMLVVVAIVGIIAAVAVPQYTDYVTRSKLTEAHSTLSEHRVKMEQFFQDNRGYTDACNPGSIAATPAGRYFAYNCGTPTGTTYTITATGIASQGTGGFIFTINQANVRTTTGLPNTDWGVVPVNCWVTKKGGGC